MAQSKFAQRILRTSAPLVGLRAAGQGAEFVAWVVLARRLAPHAFGELSVGFLACRYAGLVADWGASIRGSRDVARTTIGEIPIGLVRRRRAASIALTAVFVLVTLGTRRAYLLPLIGVLLNRGLNRDWMALGRERGFRAGLPSLALGIGALVGSLLSQSQLGAAVAIGVGYAGGLVVSLALNRMDKPWSTTAEPVDGWILLNTVADQFLITGDTLLLAVLRGSRDAGIYAAVYRLPNAWMNLAGILAAGMIPVVTASAREGADQLAAIRRTLIRIGAGLGILVLLSAPLLYWAIPPVLGVEYEDGRVPGLLIMIATAAFVAYLPLTALHLAAGRDRAFALTSLGGATISLSLDLLLIPMFGMNGAAACAATVFIALLAVHLRLTRNSDKEHSVRND